MAVNGKAAVNGKMAVNGKAAVNGKMAVNGKAAVNGKMAVNSNTFNDESNENAVLIVDSLDVYGPPNDSIIGYTSMNMISGVTVGTWLIAREY